MGRAFEYRKSRKLKRWDNMSRIFTRLSRDIEIAVKEGGADPAANPRLRLAIQNAKSENMPKDNIERAIKRSSSKEAKEYKEYVLEGKTSHGIAIIVETATDNNKRTIANIRAIFSKYGGSLGTKGMCEFLFSHVCFFKVALKENINSENLELDLIDLNVNEVFIDDNEIYIYADFQRFGAIHKYLEENGFEIKSSGFERIPKELKKIPEQQKPEIEKMIEKFEEDDDVVKVFHNME